MSGDTVIDKEMGITHEEFFRNIARALDGEDYRQTATGVVVEGDGKSLTITLAEQGERRIALMVLPVTHVRLTFRGYPEAEIRQAVTAFDLAFQRGGG